jgi:hypothetical protein
VSGMLPCHYLKVSSKTAALMVHVLDVLGQVCTQNFSLGWGVLTLRLSIIMFDLKNYVIKIML